LNDRISQGKKHKKKQKLFLLSFSNNIVSIDQKNPIGSLGIKVFYVFFQMQVRSYQTLFCLDLQIQERKPGNLEFGWEVINKLWSMIISDKIWNHVHLNNSSLTRAYQLFEFNHSITLSDTSDHNFSHYQKLRSGHKLNFLDTIQYNYSTNEGKWVEVVVLTRKHLHEPWWQL
jgi:hypothetical protein